MTERGRSAGDGTQPAIIVSILRSARPGSATGRLEVRADDVSFPEEGWTDFVLPVLLQIVDAFIASHPTSASTAQFMDGPFTIRFEGRGETVLVQGLAGRRGMPPRLELSAEAPWARWQAALDAGVDAALRELEALGPTSANSDTTTLDATKQRLKQLNVGSD